MSENDLILNYSDPILITGSNGFIGSKVVEVLLKYGFKNLRCLVRPSSNLETLKKVVSSYNKANIDIIKGNLQSCNDCNKIIEGINLVYHLAAGRGEKSYPDAFLNSVVTTRNLLNAASQIKDLRRFLNVSSFTVYSTRNIPRGGLLDESCELESQPELRGEAYCYAKVRQDELVIEYGREYDIPYVIVRPGAVYGPGNRGMTGRIGIDTFGIFLHLGGHNIIPLSYVDNCADAIVLAGIKKGIDGEIFNIVDDDLPTSRTFLKMYKQNVRPFRSFYLPHTISYFLCYLWEKYSGWSEGQLPPVYNRKAWSSAWKGNKYSNDKLKNILGWKMTVDFKEAARRYFQYEKNRQDR